MRAIILSDMETDVERVLIDHILKKEHGYDSRLVTAEDKLYDALETEQFDVAVIHATTNPDWENTAFRIRSATQIPIYAIHGIMDKDKPALPRMLEEQNIQFSNYGGIDKFGEWLEEHKK